MRGEDWMAVATCHDILVHLTWCKSGKVPSRGTSSGCAAEDFEAAHDEHVHGLQGRS